jgi:2-polyprenyl-6-methoxyphenol hydroxylase-like FAD-dependent oxidoreductase
MIAASRNFIRNDMGDLGTQPRRWYHDRIVFLGDAIHATTPNLAQAAARPLRTPIAWPCACASTLPIPRSLPDLLRAAPPESPLVVDTSWKLGKWAHSGNPLFDFAYKALLRYAPDRFFTRQEAYLNDLSYLQSVR